MDASFTIGVKAQGGADMVRLLVSMKVKDFGQWKDGFEKGGELRKNAGSTGSRIFQDAADPSHAVVLIGWNDIGKAKAFMQSPEMAARMQEAGVTGRPEMTFLEEQGDMAY
jgi:quinol monooxygenase YgiN